MAPCLDTFSAAQSSDGVMPPRVPSSFSNCSWRGRRITFSRAAESESCPIRTKTDGLPEAGAELCHSLKIGPGQSPQGSEPTTAGAGPPSPARSGNHPDENARSRSCPASRASRRPSSSSPPSAATARDPTGRFVPPNFPPRAADRPRKRRC